MADTVPSLSSYPQDPPAWRMPVLVALALLGVFVLGGVTFMVLTRGSQKPTDAAQEGLRISRAVGTPIDVERTQAVVEEVLGHEDRFLTLSLLRNTYSGVLMEMNILEAQNPEDPALELVLDNGVETRPFVFTKQTLEEKAMVRLFDNTTSPGTQRDISYTDLQVGWGMSITQVTDLMIGGQDTSQVIIEATSKVTP